MVRENVGTKNCGKYEHRYIRRQSPICFIFGQLSTMYSFGIISKGGCDYRSWLDVTDTDTKSLVMLECDLSRILNHNRH